MAGGITAPSSAAATERSEGAVGWNEWLGGFLVLLLAFQLYGFCSALGPDLNNLAFLGQP